MSTTEPGKIKRWIVRRRYGLVPGIIGGLLLAFVAANGGKNGAWLLWFALPLIVLSLAYFYIVSALPILVHEIAPRTENPDEDDRPPQQ